MLCRNLDIIKNRCLAHSVQLTFIQIPYYAIQHWNERKCHDNPRIFKENDKRLTLLVNKANDHINCLNNEIHSSTPKLNQDLMRGRKRKGGKQRTSMNFKLFLDGIHPNPKLAKPWLISIKRKINKDCGHNM